MRQEIKQYLAVSSSLMLSIASLIGIPIKAQAISNEPPVLKPKKEVNLVVHVWNKVTLKAYTKAYINENYSEWGRSEWTALK